jgi:hypothetical protein
MGKLFLALMLLIGASGAQASVCIIRVFGAINPPSSVDIYSCDGKPAIPDNPQEGEAFIQKKLDAGYKIVGQSQDVDGNLTLTLVK